MNDEAEQSPSPPLSSLGRLAARFMAPARRRTLNAALAAGHARRIATVELLAPEGLGTLARDSLWLLLAGGAVFGALEAAAWRARHAHLWPAGVGWGWQAAALIGGNLLLYVVILPLHEVVHAAVIVALGGRPQFGVRLPLALYCTAPGQIFTRGGYLAVALGPLLLLSLLGAALIWLAPGIGAYLLLALAGNVSGAVGDLAAANGVRSLPRGALIADRATGYEAYVVLSQQVEAF